MDEKLILAIFRLSATLKPSLRAIGAVGTKMGVSFPSEMATVSTVETRSGHPTKWKVQQLCCRCIRFRSSQFTANASTFHVSGHVISKKGLFYVSGLQAYIIDFSLETSVLGTLCSRWYAIYLLFLCSPWTRTCDYIRGFS